MTNTEIIQAIRNEIERLKTVQFKRIQEGDLVDAEPYDKNEAYNELLDFLDILESEKPMQKELEEEINRIVKCEKEFMNFKFKSQLIGYIARHFAQWGAEHTPLPEDTVLFNKGMEEGKRLIMEEFPKWRKIKAGEKLPCPAYVWTIAYDNYPDCFEGRLMPNIQGVKVGRDTWYLPVDVIHNLPKEGDK